MVEAAAVGERVLFAATIRLTKDEVLDIVARCDEMVEQAERLGSVEIGLAADAVRRLLLGRLMRASRSRRRR